MPRSDNMKFKIGWELEATKRANKTHKAINITGDGSVHGSGVEYRMKKDFVHDRFAVMEALRHLTSDRVLRTDSSCGFHVHLSPERKTRSMQAWVGWMVTLARMVENEAFMAVPPSRQNNSFCRKWESDDDSVKAKRYRSSKYDNDERYKWLNVVEVYRRGGIKTVEIRLLGSTHRFSYLGAWVAFCYAMGLEAWKLINDPSHLLKSVNKLKNMLRQIERHLKDRRNSSFNIAREMMERYDLFPSMLSYNYYKYKTNQQIEESKELRENLLRRFKWKNIYRKRLGILYKITKNTKLVKQHQRSNGFAYTNDFRGFANYLRDVIKRYHEEQKEAKKAGHDLQIIEHDPSYPLGNVEPVSSIVAETRRLINERRDNERLRGNTIQWRYYNNSNPPLNGEVGHIEGVRFVDPSPPIEVENDEMAGAMRYVVNSEVLNINNGTNEPNQEENT